VLDKRGMNRLGAKECSQTWARLVNDEKRTRPGEVQSSTRSQFL